ncbi:hypothetical protein JKP88DRAFT_276577 [Tribonema minus]|uniref:Isopenicillin N synthase-like Fe(2+) 2OG dioxygenase domain-containing protein n=1 Tax=Tribonema minus TaxID=303371 RepID=A0A836CHQ9_9STRA|nr:hypothetical protein JKP88DRAFT_276577 [Tribonema minus]
MAMLAMRTHSARAAVFLMLWCWFGCAAGAAALATGTPAAAAVDRAAVDRAAMLKQHRMDLSLATNHYAVVRLPEAEPLEDMWRQLQRFFVESGDEDAKTRLAGEMDNINGQVLGYAKLDENEFLETRLDRSGRLRPPVSALDGFEAALIRARLALSRVAAAVVAAAARDCGIAPTELCALMDGDDSYVETVPGSGPGNDPEARNGVAAAAERAAATRMSETVHRLCRYSPPEPEHTAAESAAEGEGPVESSGESSGETSSSVSVTFGAHTDTTMVTLVPCSVPGIQVHTRGGGWVGPEGSPCIARGRDVAVLSGELLQALSAGKFPAAVHRVVAGAQGRLSAPLLVRERAGASVAAAALLGSGGGGGDGGGNGSGSVAAALRALDGIAMEALHAGLNDKSVDDEP